LVFSIHDPTQVAIQKIIEAIQSLLMIRTQGLREVELGEGINLALKRNLELDIHSLQNAHTS
jgi:hypothetical protein